MLVILSFPAALVYGIAGIVGDSDKRLAIATTLVSAGLILAYMLMVGR